MNQSPRSTLILPLLVGALAVSAGPAVAIVRHVPDDYPSIQAAIDSAADADTVLIEAGTYFEDLTITGKGLALIGHGGSSLVEIGQNTTYPRLYRALTMKSSAGRSLRVENILFSKRTNVLGTGAGIYMGAGDRLEIIHCRFDDHLTGIDNGSASAQTYGGAVVATGLNEIIVLDSEFTSNSVLGGDHGDSHIGAASLQAGTVTVRRCRFQGNGVGGDACGSRTGALDASGGSVLIEDTEFSGNGASYDAALHVSGNTVLRRCRFIDNSARGGIKSCIGLPGSIVTVQGPLLAESCRFVRNRFNGAALKVTGGSPATIIGSVFALNTYASHQQPAPWTLDVHELPASTRIEETLIARNEGGGILSSSMGSPSAACNLVWGNHPDFSDAGFPPGAGNLNLDPSFCDTTSTEITVYPDSPSLTGAPGHPPACGAIGGVSAACERVPTTPVTWSYLKSRFDPVSRPRRAQR